MGREWQARWKGTGQFARFPFFAAEELWRRWLPERLAPYELREELTGLMGVLSQLLGGSQEAAVGPAFERIKALRERVPRDSGGQPDPVFVNEALGTLGEEGARFFNGLAEALARAGHVDDAEDFADLEEFLLPQRQGVSRAMVRAARGEREGAIEDLQKLASDGSRKPEARLLVVDALLHLRAPAPAAAAARPLLEEAERNADWHLALDLCVLLQKAYEALGDRAAMQQLLRDHERIAAAHDAAHPSHRRQAHRH
jgi:hypothetical protein